MAKVKQYPHFLFVATSGGDAVVDPETGDLVSPESDFTLVCECREESDGRGTEINVGGRHHKVTSVIQIPRGKCPRIQEGTPVRICNDETGDDVRIQGVCLKHDQAQLHSRLWV